MGGQIFSNIEESEYHLNQNVTLVSVIPRTADCTEQYSRMFAVYLVLLCFATANGQMYDDEDRLLKHLFNESRYNRDIRPVNNMSTTTEVNISQVVYSMESYDAREGKVVITSLLRVSWYDEFLKWNASDFGGQQVLSVPRGSPWLPDIAIIKGTMNGDLVIGQSDLLPVFVWNTGLVVIYPIGDVKSMCIVDVFLHPFDVHVCEFQYSSSKYTSSQLILKFPEQGIILDFFSENPEWVVENKDPYYIERTDPRYGSGNTAAVKRLTLRRRPTFDLVHSYLPSFVLTIVNTATCFVPFDGGERLSFSITVFMAFMFFSMSVVADFPKSGIHITLTSYMVISMNIFNVLIVIWSTILVKLSQRSVQEYPIPRGWLRVISFCRGDQGTCKIKDSTRVEPSENGNANQNDVVHVLATVKDVCKLEEYAESAELSREEESTSRMSWHDVAFFLDKVFFLALVIAFISLCMVWLGVLASNGVL